MLFEIYMIKMNIYDVEIMISYITPYEYSKYRKNRCGDSHLYLADSSDRLS
jgi:hypothetical protein